MGGNAVTWKKGILTRFSLRDKTKKKKKAQAAEKPPNGTSGNPIAGLTQTECLKIGFEKLGGGQIKADAWVQN